VTNVTDKKEVIETLEAQSTVLYAAKAAGISRWTAYRWRQEFDSRWDEALENAVDVVENSLYQKAVNGDTICMIFYLSSISPRTCSMSMFNLSR
jgi:hypothetical protein